MPFAVRRALRAAAIGAAALLVYAAGVVTGVVGTRASAPVPAPQPAAAPAAPGVLDEVADRIAGGAARPVDREALEQAAVRGMLGSLGDPWSGYHPASESDAHADAVEGRYSGVGLWLRPGGPTGVQVAGVQLRSPAALAGVLVGDALVSVDGRPTRGDVRGAAAALRGTGAGPVDLVLRRGGDDNRVSLRRTTWLASDVTVERLRGSVTLLRVDGFTRGAGRQVRDVLAADRAAYSGGVLLDLRGNRGGLLTEAVEVASAFLDGGAVVSYDRRGEPRRVLDALGHGDTTTPLVVLIDGGTASAAEVVAAALQERGRAVLVGSATYGKGSVQEPTRLSDGSILELTVGRYLTPSGRSLERVGVAPDVLVPADAAPGVAERRAAEVLGGLVAALAPAGSR